MFIYLTTEKFVSRLTAKLWHGAIVATTSIIANSPKKNLFLVFVGQEFFFGHNRENPIDEISINNLDTNLDINLDINLRYFSWAAISYRLGRLGKDFRSGRYRRNLGLACT